LGIAGPKAPILVRHQLAHRAEIAAEHRDTADPRVMDRDRAVFEPHARHDQRVDRAQDLVDAAWVEGAGHLRAEVLRQVSDALAVARVARPTAMDLEEDRVRIHAPREKSKRLDQHIHALVRQDTPYIGKAHATGARRRLPVLGARHTEESGLQFFRRQSCGEHPLAQEIRRTKEALHVRHEPLLDHASPLAHSVLDARIGFRVLAFGPRDADVHVRAAPPPDALERRLQVQSGQTAREAQPSRDPAKMPRVAPGELIEAATAARVIHVEADLIIPAQQLPKAWAFEPVVVQRHHDRHPALGRQLG
jgi:hypothetical protein